ncbi:MAG: 16S rRNA (cytidine(1402)-2'-O)-methyltransferase [Bdellovibrionales bacterium CG12_big_fil_rev_8_21_14_0_65_38_15]|nr:MAG: 16S rRNA (cytidine(1402)-2'-O)-methyltransferase [Bdellovibrionales bacterium CG22_combo_CG10-13_8_21_14_all_38_13]PIQ54648.1 MAG: 16S rRNA (cytidine(1402)-2'-O)-methyltransferase [Bdellovibrionales bacterium CG12_big_fil_rev_8_21_14_0_65_38_15]PIR29141.1 MAG: 16S rRNA (cytidine(1402)-2'-O)-methyltransferase [Bdellovibrionales bacterium CG11_big_fil_rev_8_21_14_0_20_38_13]
MKNERSGGCLILVSTPIGNIDDLSPRVRQALESTKHVVAEDTRVYKELMKQIGLTFDSATIHAFHDHNQSALTKPLEWLSEGHNVLIVSDAGSPLISDPAYPLVKEVLNQGYALETLPGPSAVLVALELSGLPPHPFTFHGFLPRESSKRKNFFEATKSQSSTHIVFEAPHRILATLEDLCAVVEADSDVVIARELTKTFQSVHRFKAGDLDTIKDDLVVKGEFVLLFHHQKTQTTLTDNETRQLAQKVLDKPSTKQTAKLLAKILDLDTKETYERLSQRN